MNQEIRKTRKLRAVPREDFRSCRSVRPASVTDALQLLEGVPEVIEDISRQQRLLGLIAVKNCDFRCTSTQPRRESRSVVSREALTKQAGADSGENIAHSTGGHAGIACGVVAQRPTALSHDRATAFEQKCDRKMLT